MGYERFKIKNFPAFPTSRGGCDLANLSNSDGLRSPGSDSERPVDSANQELIDGISEFLSKA